MGQNDHLELFLVTSCRLRATSSHYYDGERAHCTALLASQNEDEVSETATAVIIKQKATLDVDNKEEVFASGYTSERVRQRVTVRE